MQSTAIEMMQTEIEGFCQRHHVRRMALFGSVLRSDFTPESDVDILIEFEAGQTPGFFRLAQMQDELSAMLGRSVDLLTPGFLHASIRERVMQQARVIYDAA